MGRFILKHRGFDLCSFDIADLEPGELDALKKLAKQDRFELERMPGRPNQLMDHDALDDIAREIVNKGGRYGGRYGGQVGEIVQQAQRRVARIQHDRLS